MSRNLVIVLVVLCAGIAGLIVLSKSKPAGGSSATSAATGTTGGAPKPPVTAANPPTLANSASANNGTIPAVTPPVQPVAVIPTVPSVATLKTGIVARAGTIPGFPANAGEVPDTKPLPVLEKDYLAATNRDDRLDLMMDITDWPGPEPVQLLTRLFQAETDMDLKVDLLDSLLGIDGQVDEKLKLLTLGTAKGLPTEVRQSAIDGLIDLEDPRVVPILNGLQNDPDEEIREAAKDALEMLQTPTTVLK